MSLFHALMTCVVSLEINVVAFIFILFYFLIKYGTEVIYLLFTFDYA